VSIRGEYSDLGRTGIGRNFQFRTLSGLDQSGKLRCRRGSSSGYPIKVFVIDSPSCALILVNVSAYASVYARAGGMRITARPRYVTSL
jgi:hypothetical protein